MAHGSTDWTMTHSFVRVHCTAIELARKLIPSLRKDITEGAQERTEALIPGPFPQGTRTSTKQRRSYVEP